MYIFSRTRTARGTRMLDAMPAAVEIAGKAAAISGLDVHAWNVRFGQPMGTIMWSVRLDSQAQLLAATEKLVVDASYMDMAMSMDEFFEGATIDRLMRIVSGTPSESPSKFVTTTQAVVANGRYADAFAFGVDMQAFVHDSLGRPTVFASAAYGGFADVLWIVGSDSMDEVDSAADWYSSDEKYMERIQSGGDLFVEGSGHNGLLERMT